MDAPQPQPPDWALNRRLARRADEEWAAAQLDQLPPLGRLVALLSPAAVQAARLCPPGPGETRVRVQVQALDRTFLLHTGQFTELLVWRGAWSRTPGLNLTEVLDLPTSPEVPAPWEPGVDLTPGQLRALLRREDQVDRSAFAALGGIGLGVCSVVAALVTSFSHGGLFAAGAGLGLSLLCGAATWWFDRAAKRALEPLVQAAPLLSRRAELLEVARHRAEVPAMGELACGSLEVQ